MKEIKDLSALGEIYGADLVERLTHDIEYCQKEKLAYRIDEIGKSKHFTKFAFSTYAWSRVYEVSHTSKILARISETYGDEARKVADIMDEIYKSGYKA